jgi:predicted RNase H-like HicB family nuclease
MNKAQTYPTHVHWDERDSGFVAIAPDLPGCSAFGETQAEALKELGSAIGAWIETAIAAGEPVPEPSPLPKPSSHSGKVLLRIPASLHERLAKDAEAEGVSLNQWMVTLLSAGAAFRNGQRNLQNVA